MLKRGHAAWERTAAVIRDRRFVILLLLLLFGIRLYKFEADAPSFDILQQASMDEGYYAMKAFDLLAWQERAEVRAIDRAGGFHAWNTSVSLLNTVFSIVSLFLFGDNYYGLRMAAFVSGLLCFWIVIRIIAEAAGERQRFVLPAIGLAAVFNFPYIEACRFLDPCIFRMLLIMAAVWYVWRCQYRRKEIDFLVLGALSVFSVTWGYLTNLFLFVPCAVLFLVTCLTDKGWGRRLLRLTVGAALAYAVSEAAIYLVTGETFWESTLLLWQIMGDRVVTGLQKYINNAIYFIGANFWGYNAAFFVLSAISVLYCLWRGVQRKDRFLLYISCTVAGLAVQSVFTTDFLVHKSIVIYPVLLLNAAFWLLDCRQWTTDWSLRKRWCIGLTGGILLLALFSVRVCVYRLSLWEQPAELDRLKGSLLWINIAGVILFLAVLFCRKLWRKQAVCAVVLVSFILPHLLLSYEFIVKAGYEYKNIMTELDEIMGDSWVMGGYTYAYCLYNDFLPVSSNYDKYIPEMRRERARVLVRNEKVKYYVGSDTPEIIDEWLAGSGFHWEQIRVFENHADGDFLHVFAKVKD